MCFNSDSCSSIWPVYILISSGGKKNVLAFIGCKAQRKNQPFEEKREFFLDCSQIRVGQCYKLGMLVLAAVV